MGEGCGSFQVLRWQRSRFCVGEGHCVEWAYGDGCVYLRNSRKPEYFLSLSLEAWRGLITGIRSPLAAF